MKVPVDFTALRGSYGTAGQLSEPSTSEAPKLTTQQLQQLVAPIALYPDAVGASWPVRSHLRKGPRTEYHEARDVD